MGIWKRRSQLLRFQLRRKHRNPTRSSIWTPPSQKEWKEKHAPTKIGANERISNREHVNRPRKHKSENRKPDHLKRGSEKGAKIEELSFSTKILAFTNEIRMEWLYDE